MASLVDGRTPLEKVIFSKQGATFSAGHDAIFMFIFWLCTVCFVVMMALSAYWVVKYRRKPGVPQQRSVSHNTPLELAWTFGPLVVLGVIFVWSFQRYLDLQLAPGDSEIINVTAQKWNWSFEYDNGATTREFKSDLFGPGGAEVPVFMAPAGKPIKLIMHSKDVIHSLWVPDFRVKFDVFPMRYTTFWFNALRAGEDHYIFCAEYCGKGHSEMTAILRILEPAEYAQWKQKMAIDTRPPVEIGASLFITKACNSCHTVDGSAKTGPSWKGIFGKEETMSDGTKLTVDENYIRESILTPSDKIVAGFPNQMNSFQGQLTEKDIRSLIAYIKSLSEVGRSQLTPEETTSSEEESQ